MERVSGLHIAIARLARAAISLALKRVALARREKQVVLHPMLPGVQIVVAASRSIELFVGASLDELPLLHHQDLVGAANGRKTVRDHKRGPALHEIRKSML